MRAYYNTKKSYIPSVPTLVNSWYLGEYKRLNKIKHKIGSLQTCFSKANLSFELDFHARYRSVMNSGQV